VVMDTRRLRQNRRMRPAAEPLRSHVCGDRYQVRVHRGTLAQLGVALEDASIDSGLADDAVEAPSEIGHGALQRGDVRPRDLDASMEWSNHAVLTPVVAAASSLPRGPESAR
jgi:hypothetical protein